MNQTMNLRKNMNAYKYVLKSRHENTGQNYNDG
jgi:hypothetical protein